MCSWRLNRKIPAKLKVRVPFGGGDGQARMEGKIGVLELALSHNPTSAMRQRLSPHVNKRGPLLRTLFVKRLKIILFHIINEITSSIKSYFYKLSLLILSQATSTC